MVVGLVSDLRSCESCFYSGSETERLNERLAAATQVRQIDHLDAYDRL